jgi:hypothetical protein
MRHFSHALLCFCTAAIMAAPGRASTIPLPVTSGSAGGVPVTGTGTYGPPDQQVIITSDPNVFLTAHSVGQGSHGSGDASAGAMFIYDVWILGGQVGDVVPLLVDGWLTTNGIGEDGADVTDAQASLSLSFANGNSSALASVSCGNVLRGGDCSLTASTWYGTLSADGWAGYDNFVGLAVGTEIAGAGYANAYGASHVRIDPAFLLDHPGYSLAFPDGVGNSLGATPEPAAWLLFAGGLGLLAVKRGLGMGVGVRG